VDQRRRALLKAAAGVSTGAMLAPALLSQPASAAVVLAVRAPANPRINEWDHLINSNFSTPGWCEEFQGMCTDGTYWYIVSNRPGNQRVYKVSLDMRTEYASVRAPSNADHIGAPTFDTQRRQIYVPIEGGSFTGIWKLSTALGTTGQVALRNRAGTDESPQRWTCPWLAFNNFDNLVYSSTNGDPDATFKQVRYIWGYDRDSGALRKQIALPSVLHKVQGGTFCNAGKNLYIASDYEEAGDGLKHVYAYDFTDNADGGAARNWGKIALPGADEVECVVWAHLAWGSGAHTYITVGILDNDWPSGDDVQLRHYGVPDPLAL
jgi:hypothetical protein